MPVLPIEWLYTRNTIFLKSTLHFDGMHVGMLTYVNLWLYFTAAQQGSFHCYVTILEYAYQLKNLPTGISSIAMNI